MTLGSLKYQTTWNQHHWLRYLGCYCLHI